MPQLPSNDSGSQGGQTHGSQTAGGQQSSQGTWGDIPTGDGTLQTDGSVGRTGDEAGGDDSQGQQNEDGTGEQQANGGGQQDGSSAASGALPNDEGSKQAGREGEDSPGDQPGTDKVYASGEGMHGDNAAGDQQSSSSGESELISVLLESGNSGEDDWETSTELPGTDEISRETSEEDTGQQSSSGKEDDELDEALGVLDGEIQGQREDQAETARDASAVLVDDDGSDLITTPSRGQGSDDGQPSVAVGGTSPDEIPVERPGNIGDVKPTELPNRVDPNTGTDPDAADDDVIARQLREAALAETDPELREALWEELRVYQGGK
ncbi:MAG: hypothetical protein OXC80_03530 [Gammaproteobacteria bacterium]|nr:hypothetical protein [Gammaproteobacteria bacterium]